MNGREVVFRVIEFDGSECIPLLFPKLGVTDIVGAPAHIFFRQTRYCNPSSGISGKDE